MLAALYVILPTMSRLWKPCTCPSSLMRPPYVRTPSSLGRGSGSVGFLLQHSGEPHALRTLRNADAVHFHHSLVVHRRRVRILHTARLLWELCGGDVEDAVSK